MQTKRMILRQILAMVLGGLGTIAVFGILLTLAWYLGGETPSSKLVFSIVSAALAFLSGGIIVTWLAANRTLVFPVLFGLILGAISFGYIFGLDIAVFPLAISSAFLSGLGAWLFHRITRAKMQSSDFHSA